MSGAINRTDVPYIWPSTLRIPNSPPKLVYLDLNHWIQLSKAASGHPVECQYNDGLVACEKAAEAGLALFPISDSILIEILKIRNYRQRRDLREVIERIGRYAVVTPRLLLAVHEIEAMLDQYSGPNPKPLNLIDYCNWGAPRAFGFDEFPNDRMMMIDFTRNLIDGPSPSEESGFRRDGWNPERILDAYIQRAKEELSQVRRLNKHPKWRVGRIRDVVSAREMAFEINSILYKSCKVRGIDSLLKIFPSVARARSANDSMPGFDVSVTLKSSFHRNPSHQWKENDMHDIDALSSTIPYCEVVVTDKSMASHVTRNGLDKRFRTKVFSQVNDLIDFLGQA